jgi:small subunit ribosomal protein S23
VNLYEYHEIPLSEAYSRAVAQFRSLRSEHHVANSVAALEAEAHNAVFGRGEIERGVEVEMLGLSTWDRREELDEGAIAARKRWKAILDRSSRRGGWSKGQEYVRLWKAGVRPTYLPALEEEPQAPVRRKSIMSEVSDFVAAPVKKPQDGSTP